MSLVSLPLSLSTLEKVRLCLNPQKIGVIMAVSILVAIQIPSTVQISSPKPQKNYENAQPKPRKPLKLQAFQPVSKSVGNATKKAQPPLVAVLFSCFEASLHLCHSGYESDERARWVLQTMSPKVRAAQAGGGEEPRHTTATGAKRYPEVVGSPTASATTKNSIRMDAVFLRQDLNRLSDHSG